MERPRGTEAVRKSLLKAAADEYAAGRPLAVRAIAKRAQVNHGQVHHLFGNKDGMLREMLESLADELDAAVAAQSPSGLSELFSAIVDAVQADERHTRALARRVVESDGAPVVQGRYPVVTRMRRALEDNDLEVDPQRFAEGMATAFGWLLFRDWITSALGLDEATVEAITANLRDPARLTREVPR